jgi:hypothetical protein
VSVTINTNSSIGLINAQRFYALIGNEIQGYSQQANGSFTLTVVTTRSSGPGAIHIVGSFGFSKSSMSPLFFDSILTLTSFKCMIRCL